MGELIWWSSPRKRPRRNGSYWRAAIPATGLLARTLEKISGVEIVSAGASSKLALTWLSEGKVHVAGSHLEDPKTGEFNLPYIRKQFPDEDFSVITFARWEEGLVIAPGNPKRVRKIEDLARKNIKFVNREPGSGSRALLDKLLEKTGMDAQKVQGYDRIAYGHLAAAYCVLSRKPMFVWPPVRRPSPSAWISFRSTVSAMTSSFANAPWICPPSKLFLTSCSAPRYGASWRF